VAQTIRLFCVCKVAHIELAECGLFVAPVPQTSQAASGLLANGTNGHFNGKAGPANGSANKSSTTNRTSSQRNNGGTAHNRAATARSAPEDWDDGFDQELDVPF